jgi:hypothetical protein
VLSNLPLRFFLNKITTPSNLKILTSEMINLQEQSIGYVKLWAFGDYPLFIINSS